MSLPLSLPLLLFHIFLLSVILPYLFSYRACLTVFSYIVEPQSFEHDVNDSSWIQAMDLELHALIDNNTWELVDLPADKTLIGCKWIFKVKYKADRTMERYKARLLAKRFTQQEGLDYHETFSHVVKMVTIRSIMAIIAQYDWTLFKKPYKLHLTQCIMIARNT